VHEEQGVHISVGESISLGPTENGVSVLGGD